MDYWQLAIKKQLPGWNLISWPAMESLVDQMATAWRNRAIAIKLLSFATIGIVNTLIDVSVFTIAFKVFALPLIASNASAWLVAVSCSYLMNTSITFGRETGGIFRWKSYLRFAISGILGVTVATITLVILSHYTPLFAAKLISIVAAFAVNFSMSHFVVFRPMIQKDDVSG
jgi:putative flippase GtrA